MKLPITALAALAALVLAGCSASEETGFFNKAGFIAEISTWDAVEDVAVSDDGRIYIGMLDNGTSRDGYAGAVCEEARGHANGDLNDRRITIIDVVASVRDDKFVALGKKRCSFD